MVSIIRTISPSESSFDHDNGIDFWLYVWQLQGHRPDVTLNQLSSHKHYICQELSKKDHLSGYPVMGGFRVMYVTTWWVGMGKINYELQVPLGFEAAITSDSRSASELRCAQNTLRHIIKHFASIPKPALPCARARQCLFSHLILHTQHPQGGYPLQIAYITRWNSRVQEGRVADS
jgi:hypothetical protein